MNKDNSHSWVRISYGTVRYVNDYIKHDTENFADPQEEEDVPTSSSVVAVRSKAKAKPQSRVHWRDNHPTKWKSIDWYWTIKTRSRVVQSFEESHQSSSTQSEVTSGRRWSNSILQNKVPLTRPSSSNTKLVRWSMVSLFGCRRRTQTKISVLLWLLGINHLSPCSSRTFWGQSYWSYITGWCVDWTWNISLHLPCGKQFQSFFDYQQWIDTWRSKFEQKTICVLLAHWSKKRRPQRSRVYRLLCTTSCTILAKCMEETSRYGILDRNWSWNQRRIEVLSNKIERNYPSRNTPANCIVKAERLKNGEKLYERQYLSPRPPPKISLKHDHNWSKGKYQGSTVETSASREISFNSHLEKHFILVLPNQFNPLNHWRSTGETRYPRGCW